MSGPSEWQAGGDGGRVGGARQPGPSPWPAAGGQVIDVVDPADPRLAAYLGLREAALRRSRQPARFIAEGPLVVRRAVESGYTPESFLLTPRWVEELADVWGGTGAPVYQAATDVVEAITGFHVHRGALAALFRRERWTAAEVLDCDRLVVVEDLVDHANLGTIIRSAAALGWGGLLVTHDSADPLYRRAVKASMGAVFRLPWARLEAGADVVATLRGAGFTIMALALRDDGVDLATAQRRLGVGAASGGREPVAPAGRWEPVVASEEAGRVLARARLAVLLGSEGPGLSSPLVEGADLVVTIPMARGIDSLNVAAVAAIVCCALR